MSALEQLLIELEDLAVVAKIPIRRPEDVQNAGGFNEVSLLEADGIALTPSRSDMAATPSGSDAPATPSESDTPATPSALYTPAPPTPMRVALSRNRSVAEGEDKKAEHNEDILEAIRAQELLIERGVDKRFLHTFLSYNNKGERRSLYASEGSLLHYLELKKGQLSQEQIKLIFGQIASGLAALHSKNLVHRDLKAPNVLVTKVEEEDRLVVKVSDLDTVAPVDPDTGVIEHDIGRYSFKLMSELDNEGEAQARVKPTIYLSDDNTYQIIYPQGVRILGELPLNINLENLSKERLEKDKALKNSILEYTSAVGHTRSFRIIGGGGPNYSPEMQVLLTYDSFREREVWVNSTSNLAKYKKINLKADDCYSLGFILKRLNDAAAPGQISRHDDFKKLQYALQRRRSDPSKNIYNIEQVLEHPVFGPTHESREAFFQQIRAGDVHEYVDNWRADASEINNNFLFIRGDIKDIFHKAKNLDIKFDHFDKMNNQARVEEKGLDQMLYLLNAVDSNFKDLSENIATVLANAELDDALRLILVRLKNEAYLKMTLIYAQYGHPTHLIDLPKLESAIAELRPALQASDLALSPVWEKPRFYITLAELQINQAKIINPVIFEGFEEFNRELITYMANSWDNADDVSEPELAVMRLRSADYLEMTLLKAQSGYHINTEELDSVIEFYRYALEYVGKSLPSEYEKTNFYTILAHAQLEHVKAINPVIFEGFEKANREFEDYITNDEFAQWIESDDEYNSERAKLIKSKNDAYRRMTLVKAQGGYPIDLPELKSVMSELPDANKIEFYIALAKMQLEHTETFDASILLEIAEISIQSYHKTAQQYSAQLFSPGDSKAIENAETQIKRARDEGFTAKAILYSWFRTDRDLHEGPLKNRLAEDIKKIAPENYKVKSPIELYEKMPYNPSLGRKIAPGRG